MLRSLVGSEMCIRDRAYSAGRPCGWPAYSAGRPRGRPTESTPLLGGGRSTGRSTDGFGPVDRGWIQRAELSDRSTGARSRELCSLDDRPAWSTGPQANWPCMFVHISRPVRSTDFCLGLCSLDGRPARSTYPQANWLCTFVHIGRSDRSTDFCLGLLIKSNLHKKYRNLEQC